MGYRDQEPVRDQHLHRHGQIPQYLLHLFKNGNKSAGLADMAGNYALYLRKLF